MKKRGRPAGRQREVLAFVRAIVSGEGHAPSYGQIQAALGFGTRSEVRRIVASLEQSGTLYRAGRGRVRRINLADFRPLSDAA